MIIHELSKNERAQIIAVHADWADVLVEECYKCKHAQARLLRLLCKIGIVGAAWLNYTPYSIEDSQRDWRTNTFLVRNTR